MCKNTTTKHVVVCYSPLCPPTAQKSACNIYLSDVGSCNFMEVQLMPCAVQCCLYAVVSRLLLKLTNCPVNGLPAYTRSLNISVKGVCVCVCVLKARAIGILSHMQSFCLADWPRCLNEERLITTSQQLCTPCGLPTKTTEHNATRQLRLTNWTERQREAGDGETNKVREQIKGDEGEGEARWKNCGPNTLEKRSGGREMGPREMWKE